MKRLVIAALSIMLVIGMSVAVFSADPEGKKNKKKHKHHIYIDGERVEVPIPYIHELQDKERVYYYDHYVDDMIGAVPSVIEIPDIDIEPFIVDIPNVDIAPIVIEIPDFEFEMNEWEHEAPYVAIAPRSKIRVREHIHHELDKLRESVDREKIRVHDQVRQYMGSGHLFRDMSEEEEIRLYALRSLSRQDAEVSIPALKKTALGDESPALRFEAVRSLARFIDNEDSLPILEQVIKKDENIHVRKLAVRVLSRSDDPRAIEVLQDLID